MIGLEYRRIGVYQHLKARTSKKTEQHLHEAHFPFTKNPATFLQMLGNFANVV
jgi:hypothetical protein